ncbi:hypothetical protein HBN74_10675 [Pseudomonas sp. WS 5019]|nr:hypothetical protein [Pseudomonas sp. WS 5019]NMY16015.1 hypothetical protein [Pseudomonas sp. WS 5019]
MASRQDIENLFYEITPKVMMGLDDSDTPTSEILKIHLMTEIILEEIIRKVLGINADAILDEELRYKQKLAICAKLKLDDLSPALNTNAAGSLKKLNKIRNDAAHNINFEVSAENIEGLFVGDIGKNRNDNVRNGDVDIKLSSYKAAIYIHMLNHQA